MAESAAVQAVKQVLDRLLKYAATNTEKLCSADAPDSKHACEIVRVIDSGLDKVGPQVIANPVSLGPHSELLKQARRAVEKAMGRSILAGGAGLGGQLGAWLASHTHCPS